MSADDRYQRLVEATEIHRQAMRKCAALEREFHLAKAAEMDAWLVQDAAHKEYHEPEIYNRQEAIPGRVGPALTVVSTAGTIAEGNHVKVPT